MSYQNCLQKIAMLGKSLKENPAFKEHSLVKTSIPFLYAKESDIVICKGDIFIYQGKPLEVASLNFKRREFQTRPIWEGEIKNAPTDKNISMLVSDLKGKRASAEILSPSSGLRYIQ
jgi:hypothetical protein